MLGKFCRLFSDFRALFFWSEEERRLLGLLKQQHAFPDGPQRMLVQIIEDYSYLLKFIFFLHAWRKKTHSGFRLAWIWILPAFRHNKSFQRYWLRDRGLALVAQWKWQRFFRMLGGEIVFSHRISIREHEEADRLYGQVENAQDILGLRYREILIGDLIYDSYLRFAHRPTINLNDPFLKELLLHCVHMVDMYEEAFAKEKYDLFLTSYTSYTLNGVPSRAALKHGIPVYAMGVPNQLIAKPTLEFPFHKRNFHQYREWFAALPEAQKTDAIRRGHEGLRNRLKGVRDAATGYMKVSAYADGAEQAGTSQLPVKQADRLTILLMGHDFFDSPHIYGEMLFPDFYLWMDSVLPLLLKAGFEVIVKPHPNAIEGNAQIYQQMAERYPGTILIPGRAPTLPLLERGVDLVLTVYGTVAHELAYLGQRVLCAGENPHASFSFCATPMHLNEYLNYLQNPHSVARPAPESDEVAAFYTVHNYRLLQGEMDLFPPDVNCKQALAWLNSERSEFKQRLEVCEASLAKVESI